jgi:predicted ATP-dependent serine protease
VAGLEARLRAAAQLGFRAAVVPKSSALDTASTALRLTGVASVGQALEALLP